jgi:AcrR family transcriptional regulator
LDGVGSDISARELSEFASIEYTIVSMVARDTLLPAPGRGQYDRQLPRQQRLAEQRERVLAATALVAAGEASPSVASIVRRAGVGRNTFYESFDDVGRAVEAAVDAVVRRLERALREVESTSRTPVERWRALARVWLAFAADEPQAMLLVLAIGAHSPHAISSGGAVLEAALVRSLETLRNAGVAAPPASAERLLSVTAAGEAFARAVARAGVTPDEALSVPNRTATETSERERFERALADVAVRLLR